MADSSLKKDMAYRKLQTADRKESSRQQTEKKDDRKPTETADRKER